ncbi:hypothetical protein ASPVEDRAFT_52957 [Aspergillus versicolor CBS 583.65]|uniref:NmrA-like domain-containing protein n=1 Tax=Aspergillus versicolor CBS 583.65 TaxID=1036611 RepID=A0A1L9PL41_ASPVE|nr:uncharacterized protein ASPVEDRAFT_52957 [Aspergillus versicolor CBS 583.65]OJJ02221.1 hypothetical protein ASPVEDRAFT_52957 [Aspergillus versicolor CBS 583.65]
MPSPKVFITGATGYIGGDFLYVVANAHPDWQLSALIRNKDKEIQVKSQYPNVRVVNGDLDSTDVIENEVKEVDIVLHFANCDHVASATAIAKGAQQHRPERPVWIIHTSGTSVLSIEDQRACSYGIDRAQEYNDWDGVRELVNLPADAVHRNVDEIILAASKCNQASVKTAIVCPPTIYGPGRGPGNQKSIQAYLLAAAVLKRGRGFLVGAGENIWHQVHIQDLSSIYMVLAESAAAGGGKATWNEEGYYLAEDGPFVWGDVQRAVAKEAFDMKLIPSPEVEQLTDAAHLTNIFPAAIGAWGSNSRGYAIRARKLFDWDPKQPKLIELIRSIVEIEAKDMGLLPQ